MLRKLTATSASWFPAPLRLALGIIFIAHGSQKVFGTFGGPGLSKWTTLSQLAPFSFMRPTWLWLAADAISEFAGGILILLGLFTRVGAFLIACAMLTAILGVHWPHFFLDSRGLEYAMALLAMCLALLVAGGGQASIDRLIAKR
jgi:putative oxidoreductase